MKLRSAFVLAIAFTTFACDFASAADKFFPLGIWYEGGVGAVRQNVIPDDPAKAAAQYDRDFADIEAHGINVIVIPNSPPAHHQAVLDAAQKHHLKVILETDLDGGESGAAVRKGPFDADTIRKSFEAKLGPVKSHPALWRVQLLDEPPAGTFDRYRKVADVLKEFDPEVPGFCCLAGTGAVNEFAKVVQPDVIAWDNYPLGPGTPPGEASVGPLKAFTEAAYQSALIGVDHHADVWGVIQCHDFFTGLRLPTPAEVRCMTYATLGAGSHGVFWFLYQTERFDPEGKNKMRGLVDEQYQSSDRWDEVAKLTKELTALSPILTSGLTPMKTDKKFDPSTMQLKSSDGKTYAFVINFDTEHAKEITSHLEGMPVTKLTRMPAGESTNLHQVDGATEWTQKLEPGNCAIYRID